MERLENFVRIYITAGRGTEAFAEMEIQKKTACTQTHRRDGKVFVRIPYKKLDLEKILSLKSIERAFIAITDYDNSNFIQNKKVFLDKLMSEFSRPDNFSAIHLALNQLQALHVPNSLFAVDSFHSNKAQLDKNEGNLLERKGHLHSDKQICSEQNVSNMESNSVKEPPNKKVCLENDVIQQSGECSDSGLDIQTRAEKMIQSNPTFSKNLVTEVNTGAENKNSSACSEKLVTNPVPHSSDDKPGFLTFRVCVKCSGKVSRWLNTQKLSKDIGWRVARVTGWRVNLRHPDIEVSVHISDGYVTAGIPMSRYPLSKRDYIVASGLRAPVAWIMYHLAHVQLGDIVLDPMCGRATILLESGLEFQEASYIGGDTDLSQLQVATQNLHLCKKEHNISILMADSLTMPFRDNCIDIVICDAPFNLKYLLTINTESFYMQFLGEVCRVLRQGGRCVLLVSRDIKKMLLLKLPLSEKFNQDNLEAIDQAQEVNHQLLPLTVLSTHDVKLGETEACIVVFNKI
ncbi:THUMP domain-containing protein 2-like isoform X2 [Physella acuta]|uniref:THUMP domain-containing protein 2-like isoform X2 n=1 Tax=Physella acuta TaxID=109671 RepID=UPI0027DB8508|nr:THUMP domain-containing protein 2-like isoform X2 [Physella acuta]